jgi:hypothetical protein
MTLKVLNHPTSGKQFRMGRLAPSPEKAARTRMLRDYLVGPVLPTAPLGPLGRMAAVPDVVVTILANDAVGDCTIAAEGHLVGIFTGNANPPPDVFTDEAAILLYSVLSGYVPGNEATDTGLDEVTVLDNWRSTGGFAQQHKIAGYVQIDATDVEMVKFAIWIFFNGYLGVSLPNGWVTPMPSASGFVWQIAGDPVPENGHAICAVDYDDEGIIVLTWGMWGKINWAAVAKYLVESAGGAFYVVFTQEILERAKGVTPTGINWTQLEADWQTDLNGATT